MTGTAAKRALPAESFAAFALDITPVGFRPQLNRHQVEELILADRFRNERDSVWEAYFVEQIVEFVVHGRRPTGVITQEDAQWLVSLFGDKPGPSVPSLLRGLVSEAENVPNALIGYALACGAMRI